MPGPQPSSAARIGSAAPARARLRKGALLDRWDRRRNKSSTGVDVPSVPRPRQELVRVSDALVELPQVAEAFASGSLSYDKVRLICQVASPEDQEVWVELAQTISGSPDSQERAEAQLARRGLWTFKEEDGMVRLTALLPAADAAVVMTALEAVAAEQPPVPLKDTSAVPDPAEDRWAARRADSLVAICEQATALAGSPEGLVSDPSPASWWSTRRRSADR